MIRARAAPSAVATEGLRAVLLSVGLAAVVVARFVAWTTSSLDAVTLGLAFGAALGGIALLDRRLGPGRRSTRRLPPWPAVLLGLGGGLALVVLALVGASVAGNAAAPAILEGAPTMLGVPFGPWALATIVVAGGEEAVLRGALFDRLTGAGGIWTAILVTSVTFALIHVPFYGWRVVPLDVGVGVWLAGIRLETRGLTGPWAAHVVADLATWWL